MQRVEALGLGLSVKPGRHMQKRLCESVSAVIRDRGYRQRSRKMQKTLQAWDGPRSAARAIDAFAGRRRLRHKPAYASTSTANLITSCPADK